MKKTVKLISLLLALLMLAGAASGLSLVTFAEDTTEETTDEGKGVEVNYLTDVFATPEDKLATMKKKLTRGNYELYCDSSSGEVAVKDLTTEQIMFTNPYDIGTATSSDSIKYQVMSQIIIKYEDNGKEKEFSSYEYAAMRDQITVKNIKNGIRVEYIIGREEARHLVPRLITAERFETMIRSKVLEYYNDNVDDFYFKKFVAYYQFKSLESEGVKGNDRLTKDMLASFPIVAKYDVYVFDPTAKTTEIEKEEEVIKMACPEYSYEEMDYDHQLTEYESDETNPPVFKMALEYTLTDDGFSVRLPANGITFNESLYRLKNISILPYMGAGNNAYTGYVFYPDGSGTLFSMEDLASVNTTSVSSKIYGNDFAYHEITGTYQKVVRYPVFGIVENTEYFEYVDLDATTDAQKRVSALVYNKLVEGVTGTNASSYNKYNKVTSQDGEIITEKRGFTAIIEEGEALANLVYYHAGVLSPYDTVQMNFNPRPQDTYNLQDAVSVGANTEVTVVTNRKYTGSFKVHYVMLTDSELAKKKGISTENTYEATWLGMAKAYRDYLVKNGVLTQLTADDVEENIPLYIESFGSMETTEKVASIPITVKKALTSAADVLTMYNELSEQGVKNINFKLTGYANGGMASKMPYRLKWTRAVQKDNDTSMQDLFNEAKKVSDSADQNLGIYPDFDFAYVNEQGAFDGLTLRKHCVRTIDDRYTSKREYSATQQKYVGYYQMCISPAYYYHFYEKLISKYLDYDNVTGISVATLGYALNSDFDEDEPYNREDSLTFTEKALAYISDKEKTNLSVMLEGGNVYTWKYADHILGVSLDSSRYIKASYSVPFVGVVLHGFVEFAGTPLNMEGDIEYAKLKALENGASLYFTLSYENTELLKENKRLSKYYSIRYDIWKDDLVEIYNEMNGNLKDLQDKLIIGHEFLSGERVPDVDEFELDITTDFDDVLDYQRNKVERDIAAQKSAIADARAGIANVQTVAEDFVTNCLAYYSGVNGCAYQYVTGSTALRERIANYTEARKAYDTYKAKYDAADDEEKAAMAPILNALSSANLQALTQMRSSIRNVSKAIFALETSYKNLSKLLEDAKEGAILINGTEGMPQSIIDEIAAQLENTENIMRQQLGVSMDQSVGQAEIDTFIKVHDVLLLLSCYGEDTRDQYGAIGKAENLFEMLGSREYGLTVGEVDMLRYLEENANLTDEQLIAKYGLSADKTSLTGFVKYLRELIGEDFTFDPALSDTASEGEMSEVDKNVLGYYENILFEMIVKLDSSLLPNLNFVQTRKVANKDGKLVDKDNTTNITNLRKSINTEIENALTGAKGVLAKVNAVSYEDYRFDTVVDEATMKALVEKCAGLVTDASSDKNKDAGKEVTYATPETLETDLTNYIRAYWYKTVISKVKPASATESMAIMTILYTTDTSLASIAAARYQEIGAVDDTLAEAYAKMDTDETAKARIAAINGLVSGAYGDVTAELNNAYAKAYAKMVLSNAASSLVNKDKSGNVTGIRSSVSGLVYTPGEDGKDDVTVMDYVVAGLAVGKSRDALVTEVVAGLTKNRADAIAAGEGADKWQKDYVKLADDIDFNAEALHVVTYAYLDAIAASDVVAFYYDSNMGAMDAMVRAKVNEMHDEIVAALGNDYTAYDIYDAILAKLGSTEFSVADYTAQAAGLVSYHINEAKYSMTTDTKNYFGYLLVNSFKNELPVEAPFVTLENKAGAVQTGKNYQTTLTQVVDKAINDITPALLTKATENAGRGQIPDYSLSTLLTQEEYAEIIDSLADTIINNSWGKKEKWDSIRSEVEAYFRYVYANLVLTQLSADKKTTFHVSDIYGDDIYSASQGFKRLLRFYVTLESDLTEADIDALVGGTSAKKDDEEQEVSKYVSDDGRIVAVTYGNNDGTTVKTFLLNYNNFSVSVVYKDVTYTIPAYDYIVVWPDQP